MAVAGQQIDELFISLGLDVAQLQLDFDTAGKTVSNAISKLNSETNKIKIQMDTDLSNLDGIGTELDKIQVKYEAINRQLDLQRQKESILAAVLKDAQNNTGRDSGVSRKSETDLLRQQKLIAQTEAEVRKLESALQNAGKAQSDLASPKVNQLLESYKKLKGNVAGNLSGIANAFSEIKTSAGSADGAITKSLEIIGSIPHPAGKAVAALAAIPLVMHGVENSLINLAKPAIASGDAFYVMSRGMQMSIRDAAQLSMICKVTGIDIQEVNSALRRFSSQVSKAGNTDTPMLKMLRQYGAEIRDSGGKIKNEIELASELGNALKKAQAEGRGAEFRDIVGGKFWSGDFVTFLEDFADNVEQAKKVVKNGLADPARAHALQGELNTLDAQMGQLNSAFSSAFMPLAEVLIPRTTERMGELTKIIADNADGIKTLGDGIAIVLDSMETVATKAGGLVIKTVGSVGELVSAQQKNINERYLNDENVKSVEDLMQRELQRSYTPTEKISIENNPVLYQQTLAHFQPLFQGLEEARKQSEAKAKAVNEAVEQQTYSSFHELKGYGFNDSESIRKTVDETKKLSDELYKLTHSDFDNKNLDVYRWREKLLADEATTAEQRELIEKITAEKIVQNEREKEERISQIRQSANANFQNNLQKRFEQIDKERDAWVKAGMEEAEANSLAEKQKAQAIKSLENEVASEIRSIWGTELENRLAQVDTERQAWIQKGVDETYATQLSESKKAKIIQDFNNDIRANLYSTWQTDLEKRLSQIDRETQAWIKKGVDEKTATAWAESEKIKTMQNFENEVVANINSIWQTELQNRLDQIDREAQAWKQKGLDEVKATEWAEQAKADARKNAAMSVLKSQLEEYRAFRDGGFQGLRDYQLGQLYKAGITDADLKITPHQLESFQSAKKLSESSLLPNLMSLEDMKNYYNATKPDYSRITITQSPQSGEARIWSNNPQEIAGLNVNNQGWADLSQKLSDLNATLTDFSGRRPTIYSSDGYGQAQQRQQLTSNIAVNIQEAHAWDSEHIQELAEKVADKITPEIENALSNSNSY